MLQVIVFTRFSKTVQRGSIKVEESEDMNKNYDKEDNSSHSDSG